MGSDIEVEELMYVGCYIVLGVIVVGGVVLYVGMFEILVEEVVAVF